VRRPKPLSFPLPAAPPLITVAILGRRVELDLVDGRVALGVATGLSRIAGVLWLAPVGERLPSGVWRPGSGARMPYGRDSILRITVLDKDMEAA